MFQAFLDYSTELNQCASGSTKVELVDLITGVTALTKENSHYTQFLNCCYKMTNNTKAVVVEILPWLKSSNWLNYTL